jgi:small subunit ribosomal protein S18
MTNAPRRPYSGGGSAGPGGPGKPRRYRAKRKVCIFCVDKVQKSIDYKMMVVPKYRQKVTSERGKIVPRRTTGTCAKCQRRVAEAVKRARHMAILPFVTD